MTYATVSELVRLTGSYIATDDLQAILDDADRKVKSKLAVAEVSAPSSDDGLKSACLCLGKAKVIDRSRTDGANTDSPLHEWSHDEVTEAIRDLKEEAGEFIAAYILTSKTNRYRWSIRKVNA